MAHVVYNRETTIIVSEVSGYRHKVYDSESTAKAAITRMVNKGMIRREDVAIAETSVFFSTIEKKHIRKGIVHSEGRDFEVGVNTPWSSGPWSEAYWCM